MKNLLILATMVFTFGLASAQTFDKSLAGMYESTSGSDWVSLKDNGTGKLYITSDYMKLGSFSFTWTSDEDQVFIKFKDELGYETSKWAYWSKKNGVSNLDFPTGFGPNLNFIKTR
jgi:hypothetical protein